MPNDNTHTLLPCPFCGRKPYKHLAKKRNDQNGDPIQHHVIECQCRLARIEDWEDEAIAAWNTRTPAEPKGEIRAIKDEAASTDRVPVYRTESAEPKAGDWGARAFIIDHNKRMYAAGEDEKQAAFELERSVSILNTRALSSAAPRITEEDKRARAGLRAKLDALLDETGSASTPGEHLSGLRKHLFAALYALTPPNENLSVAGPHLEQGAYHLDHISPAPLSGITEQMVERVVAEFADPIKGSFDRTGYDDGAEYAALEIKDRLIALLRQQGAEVGR